MRNPSRGARIFKGATAGSSGVLVLGLAAAALMVVAHFSNIYEVTINGLPCEPADANLQADCAATGGDRHSFALLVLAAVTVLMAWGAGARASRPAALALVFLGLAVLVIGLAFDLPDVNETGAIGVNFDLAAADPARGFWLELGAGALALATGLIALRRSRG